jgi:O-antigen/teichoic acid export membrane protein/O-antigen ligase
MLGLPSAVTYYIARDPAHARRIVSSLAWFGVLQLGAVLVLQAAALAVLVASDPPHVRVAAAISLLLPPGILALSFGVAILQGQRRFTAFNVFRIMPSTAYVVGVVIVYALNATSLVLFMALWAAVNLIGGFFALAFAVRGLPKDAEEEPGPPREQMVKFGLKALLGSLSPVDVVRLDQAVVGLFLTPVALGYYVVGQAFSVLPRVVAASVGMVAYPQVAAERDRHSARRGMWRFFFLGLTLAGLLVVALELIAGELISLLFGDDFTEATTIAQILLLASLFMAGRRVLTDGVNGLGYPGYGTIAEVTSWILLLPSLAILLPWFGAEGVALALAASWGASLLLLVALALVAGRPVGARRAKVAEASRRLAAFPRRLQAGNVLVVAAAALLSVLGGLAAVFFPTLAVVMLVALAALLLFAFARRALSEHPRPLQPPRVVDHRYSPLQADQVFDNAAEDGFDVPRRLYYGGVLLLGLVTLRVFGQVTFSDLLFLASFLFACAELVILRRRVPVKLPFLLLMGVALFSLGGLLSTFESYEALKSIAVIARLVFLAVFWLWLGTIVLRRPEHITRAIACWVMSAALCGAGAIVQLVIGDVIPNAGIDGGRATGFTGHPNDLGALTAIAFVPALMLASRPRISAASRALFYSLLLLVAAGLILSVSIGALIAAACAVFVWLVFQRPSVHSVLALATLAACLVALLTLQSMRGAPDPLERFETATSTSSQEGVVQVGSVHQRIGTYQIAIERIKEDPFVGVGLDLYSVTRPFGVEAYEYDVHNLVIGLWYKTGLFGLVGMLLALLAIARSGWTAISESISRSERTVAVALGSSVVAFVVFAMTAPILFTRLGWISAALVLALRAVQQERIAAVEPAPAPRDAPRALEASFQS